MKLFRRISAFVMAFALLLSLSITVFAVDYDAANFEDLSIAFGDTSGEDVNINVTADISGAAEDGHYVLDIQEGVTYNVSSENGSSISDISFWGEGTLVVDTKAEGQIGVDQADATFNKGIDGDLDAYESTVTVNGDVSGNVNTYVNSSVAVDGNVDGSIYGWGNASVSVEGDVGGDVDVYDSSSVTVGGDVDGYVYVGNAQADVGGDVNGGVSANGDSAVNVDGNVSGGTYSFETDDGTSYEYGTAGVSAYDGATVTVGGNVSGGDGANQGGAGVEMSASTVTVGGNVTGGDSSAEDAVAMPGAMIACFPDAPASSLTVEGSVTAGEGDVDFGDLYVQKAIFDSETDPTTVEVELPEISVGSVDTVTGYGFSEEELAEMDAVDIEDHLNYEPQQDTFWQTVIWKLYKAESGSELTVNAKYRTMLTSAGTVLKAVRESGVTLVIQWNGGDDIVITPEFAEDELRGPIALADLAEMVKK